MLQYKQDLGFRLARSFRRFVAIESQNSPCCSVVHTVNQLGPELTIKYMDAVLNAIKSTPEYIANSKMVSDRLLRLFVRSAIRKTLLDITDKPFTMYLPSFKRESNDATRPRQITSDTFQEHSKRNAQREIAEPSDSNRNEQSGNEQRKLESQSQER